MEFFTIFIPREDATLGERVEEHRITNVRQLFDLANEGAISITERDKYLADFYRFNNPSDPEADILTRVGMAIDLFSGAQDPLGKETEDAGTGYDEGTEDPLGLQIGVEKQEEQDPFGIFQRYIYNAPQFAGISPSLRDYASSRSRASDAYAQWNLANLAQAPLIQQGTARQVPFEDWLGGRKPWGAQPVGVASGINVLQDYLNLIKSNPGEIGNALGVIADPIREEEGLLSQMLMQGILSRLSPSFRSGARKAAGKQFSLYQALNPEKGQIGLIDFAKQAGYIPDIPDTLRYDPNLEAAVRDAR